MVAWHSLKVEDVLMKLQSSFNGLSDEEAINRLKIYGYNEIPERKRSVLKMFLRQFTNFLVIILIIASLIALALGELIDSLMIIAIIMLMGSVGFIQEYRSEKTLELLKKLATPTCTVIRDGVEKTVYTRELVPGDIITLREGDRVPADARVIESIDLEVDESTLTGESTPIFKEADLTLPIETIVSDRRNMVFMGTYVVRGKGKAVVVATGVNTEVGKIAKAIAEAKEERTPLERELDYFGRKMGLVIIAISLIIFITYIIAARELSMIVLIDSLLLAIALAVAAIPEGLPAIATAILAIGAREMSKRKALVRRLAAVEALGSCNVICSDKTGTITKGEMTVKRIFINGTYFNVTGSGYDPKGEVRSEDSSMVHEKFLFELARYIASHCSLDSRLERNGDKWVIKGSPTEGAALVLSYKILGSDGVDRSINELKVVKIFPFDRFRKRKTTVHMVERGRFLVVSSGAPELLLKISSKVLWKSKVVSLDEKLRKILEHEISKVASEGYRTYGFAYKIVDGSVLDLGMEEVEKDLTFFALLGMIDPPREEVRRAVEITKEAGVKTVMVTGDHKLTAIAVARMIGLEVNEDTVIDGSQLDNLSDEEFYNIVDKITVYTRVTPEHKARIVKALKKKGYTVAMTGDGVNDAPALKIADIGVAMGVRGTDVAKEASQLILLDDNFVTLVEAVKTGRVIYENLKKPINYLLSCNMGEIITVFGGAVLGGIKVLSPVQLLWINLTTDALPAAALGVEPPEPGIMRKPPRGKEDRLITNKKIMYYLSIGLIIGTITLILFFSMLPYGLKFASTVAFTAIALSEFGRAFACRSENTPAWRLKLNKWIWPATLASATLQLLAINPPLNLLFNTVQLPIWALLLTFSVPIMVYVVDELRKVIGIKI